MSSIVGIDGRLIGQTGVGTYIKNLVFYLSKNKQDKDLKFNLYVLPEDLTLAKKYTDNFEIKPANFRWHSLSEQTGFYAMLKNEPIDLMHFTYFSYPVLYKKPFIATVHDLTPLFFKTGKASTKNKYMYELKYQIFSYILKNQIQNSKAIITPTFSVKNQILDHYDPKLNTKINPIYEGVDFELMKATPSNLANKYNFEYFLYIGNFYPHKNIPRLIEGYEKVKTNVKLLLVGPDDFFTSKIHALIKQKGLENAVILETSKSKDDLLYFYSHARALVHPSLSEGFGLTLAEAAYTNLPIIASAIAPIKELFGESIDYFTPQDTTSITTALTHFLQEKRVFDYLNVLNNLSFEKMAQQTVQLYKNTLDKSYEG